jgi:hypothetical protein
MVVDQIVLDHNKMQRFPSTDTKGLDHGCQDRDPTKDRWGI